MKLTEENSVNPTIIDFQEKLMTTMQEYFAALTDDQRVELISRFNNIFCIYCGCKQPKWYCQCRNDE